MCTYWLWIVCTPVTMKKKKKKKKKNLLNSSKKIRAMPGIEHCTSAPEITNVKAEYYEDI